MIQIVAATACAAFILYLYWMSERRGYAPSHGLWIPVAWMFLAGSRWLSSWLGMAPSLESASDYAEGSPIDRYAFLALLLAGAAVLARRRIAWGQFLSDNKWIVLYLVYCLASVAWSDDPYISFRRWVKDLGNPIMALVILTDPRPYEALGVVLRRITLVLIPLSVLFVRYFPDLGREFRSDGTIMYTGVGQQKNDLGLMCLLAGIYLAWELLREHPRPRGRALSIAAIVVLAAMALWLLYLSDSQTSLVCLIVGIAALYVFRNDTPARHPYWVLAAGAAAALAAWGLDQALDLHAMLYEMLGRSETLTNRTEVWELVREFEANPWVGTGFMSFWTGDRLNDIWKLLASSINQAHNGYLEQYLNLGYVGVGFIVLITITGLGKAARQLAVDRAAGMLRVCLILVAYLYNYTEAAFYGMNNMWLLLLVACIDVPGRTTEARVRRSSGMHAGRRLVAASRAQRRAAR